VRKKLIKNSQLLGKKFQKTTGEDFFDLHCISGTATKQLPMHVVGVWWSDVIYVNDNDDGDACVQRLQLQRTLRQQ